MLVNLRLDQIMMDPGLAPSAPPAVTYSVVIIYNLRVRDQSWGKDYTRDRLLFTRLHPVYQHGHHVARAGRFNGGGFIVLEERVGVVLGDTSIYTSWVVL